jgi:alpha-glucosidase
MKTTTLLVFLLSTFALCQGETLWTKSPDNALAFGLVHNEGLLSGRLMVDGKEVVSDMPIAITIDGTEYPGQTKIQDTETSSVQNTITPVVPTIRSSIKESCNQTLVQFDAPVALRIRVYNDGIAFRWESQLDKKEILVNSETFSLHFAEDYPIYFPKTGGRGFSSHQEALFNHTRLSKTKGLATAAVPLLVELDGDKNLLLTDVNVEAYPGLWIHGATDNTLSAVFPHYPAQTELKGDRTLTVAQTSDFLAKTQGTRSFPWRAFVITDDAGLLTSTLLYTLADECRLKDTSWIKPGKVSWDWWNALNLTDVSFKSGINQNTYKHYADFAADNHLQYIILDEGWSQKGPENLLSVVPALNIGELVQYAEAKGIGVILWMTSTALEQNFEQAFEQFSAWGIKGIKVDFMQRDDQVMMDFCEKVAATAAEHHLLVDFHGGSKPTGLHRTYPNVLTHESVRGLEQNKWSKVATPEMAALLPFIRMAVGPMDYTPGAMDNYTAETFKAMGRNPGSHGTRCHQLAMYVVYVSPLQMLADTPSKYRRNPECMPFLQEVPTVWDETVVLKAELGKVVALARRNGTTWYLGALTDWDARELTCTLDFLSDGNYQLRYWADGPDAATEATDTSIGKSAVTRQSELTLKLAPGGGYAAILKPVQKD